MNLTTSEIQVLRALRVSAESNGDDFGIIEQARRAVADPASLGGIVASLSKKNIIEVHEAVVTDSGRFTQFTWEMPVEEVEALLDGAKPGIDVKALPVPSLPATEDDIKFLGAGTAVQGVGIRARIVMERAVMRLALQCLTNAGYSYRLHDGEEWATVRTNDPAVIMADCMATDEETLKVVRPREANEDLAEHIKWVKVGSVTFTYGNAGWEVISNHSVSLSEVLKPVDEYTDILSGEF